MKKIVLSILILTFTWYVKAQDDLAPINTGAVNFLTITPDARSAGMEVQVLHYPATIMQSFITEQHLLSALKMEVSLIPLHLSCAIMIPNIL